MLGRYSKIGVTLLGGVHILLPLSGHAQEGGKGKIEELLDSNGINVSTATNQASASESLVSIGEAEQGGISFVRSYSNAGVSHNFNFQISNTVVTDISGYTVIDGYYSVTIGNFRGDFDACSSTSCTTRLGDGATLTKNATNWYTGTYVYTAHDGSVGIFDLGLPPVDDGNSGYAVPAAWGRTLTHPNGEKITLTYYQDGGGGSNYPNRKRLTSIESNFGYLIKLEYASDARISGGTSNNTREWHRVTKVTAINKAVEYCSPTALHCGGLTQNWPTATISYAVTNVGSGAYPPATVTYSSTADGGTKRQFIFDATGWPDGYRERFLKNYSKGSPSASVISMVENGFGPNITTSDGATTYSWSSGTLPAYAGEWDEMTVERTDPVGGTRSIRSVIYDGKPREIVDENGRSWKFQYDSEHRLKYSIPPEGTVSGTSPPTAGFTEYTYDARGNVTQTKVVPKAGSGLANIVTTASYPSTCTYPKTCNQPTWTRDAKGNQTDYTYNNTHGGVLTEMGPAPAAGQARPLTLTTYAQRYAWIKNASGALVQSSDPIWLVNTVTACQTVAGSSSPVCDTSAPKTVTTYQYGASGTREALLVKGVAVSSAGTTLRTCYGYDIYNRKISETQPNANLGVCP